MRSAAPLARSLAARVLLALAFLLAQQTASLHWLSHAIEAAQAKASQSPSPTHHCDECVQLGALGTALATGTSSALLPAAEPHALRLTFSVAAARAPPRLAFRSRAPPPILT